MNLKIVSLFHRGVINRRSSTPVWFFGIERCRGELGKWGSIDRRKKKKDGKLCDNLPLLGTPQSGNFRGWGDRRRSTDYGDYRCKADNVIDFGKAEPFFFFFSLIFFPHLFSVCVLWLMFFSWTFNYVADLSKDVKAKED